MAVSALERVQFRKARVREKIKGFSNLPRLSVYRSLNHIYAQLVDDAKGETLTFVSSLDKALRSSNSKTKKEIAHLVGKLLAEKALQLKIKKVVFDRGGRVYHGRIQALADGARKGGLEF